MSNGEQIKDKNIIKRYIKKMLKKALDWYINPIILQQNQINNDIQNVHVRLDHLQDEYEKKLNVLEHKKITQYDLTEEFYLFLQKNIQDLELLKQSSAMETEKKYVVAPTVNDIISLLKDKQSDNVAEMGHMFRMQLLQKSTAREYIVLICEDFSDGRKMEAIRKETYVMFNKIKERSVFLPLLVSLKIDSKEFYADNDIFHVGDQCLPDFLSRLNVKMLIWNCPVVSYAHCAAGVTLKYPTLLRLTSQNPLQMDEEDIKGYPLDALLHINDYGFLHMRVMSEYAKNKLETVGFKNVSVSVPQIDISNYRRKDKNGTQRTIGFASSPMLETQIEKRGIGLLSKVVTASQDFNFKILWRDSSLKVPEELSASENVEIIYGLADMDLFFEEIDSIVIPYASSNNNHGCSLSAMEAMLYGIPVIATDISGVSEWVKRFNMGLVCTPSADALYDSIHKLYDNYETYRNHFEYHHLCEALSADDFISDIRFVATAYRPDNIVTLDEWSRALQSENNSLIVGRENIKKYYSQFSVAEHYTEQRFSFIHDRCFDLFERLSIDYLIEQKPKGSTLRILDIATGDGRILQEDIRYGDCIAMDQSSPMLNLVHERFSGAKNLETIQGDYFTDIITDTFDIITTFRYIRHFSYKERKALYQKIKSNLKEDGVLIFDVPNIKFEMEQRAKNGWHNYNIYDVFWTKEGIVKELNENGFRIHAMVEVGTRLTQDSDEPMTWTIGAIKKN